MVEYLKLQSKIIENESEAKLETSSETPSNAQSDSVYEQEAINDKVDSKSQDENSSLEKLNFFDSQKSQQAEPISNL